MSNYTAKNMRKIVNSEHSLSEAIGLLRKTFKEKKYFSYTIHPGKDRTLSQNALSHAWYSQVSAELGEYSPGRVKCICKLHVGLSILRGANTQVQFQGELRDINDICASFIDPLPYENQVDAMEFFPVTSRMSTEQLSQYLEIIQHNYRRRGVNLEFPEEP